MRETGGCIAWRRPHLHGVATRHHDANHGVILVSWRGMLIRGLGRRHRSGRALLAAGRVCGQGATARPDHVAALGVSPTVHLPHVLVRVILFYERRVLVHEGSGLVSCAAAARSVLLSDACGACTGAVRGGALRDEQLCSLLQFCRRFTLQHRSHSAPPPPPPPLLLLPPPLLLLL